MKKQMFLILALACVYSSTTNAEGDLIFNVPEKCRNQRDGSLKYMLVDKNLEKEKARQWWEEPRPSIVVYNYTQNLKQFEGGYRMKLSELPSTDSIARDRIERLIGRYKRPTLEIFGRRDGEDCEGDINLVDITVAATKGKLDPNGNIEVDCEYSSDKDRYMTCTRRVVE